MPPSPKQDRKSPDEFHDRLVINDLHLGSDVCQASLLKEFLEWAVEDTHELIINGDIFDDFNFNRLSKQHFACLKVIRRNSDRDDLRLVWVRGHHDGPAEVVGHIVGIEILDEYVFEKDQLRLMVLHGDQFDLLMNNYGWLTEVACGMFYYIQKWAPHQAARYIGRVSKQWQRSSLLIRDGAVAYAAGKGFRHVTCGHTNPPVIEELGGVPYANRGTSTDHPPCPFVAVKGGKIRLEYWPTAKVRPSSTSYAEAAAFGRAPSAAVELESLRPWEFPVPDQAGSGTRF